MDLKKRLAQLDRLSRRSEAVSPSADPSRDTDRSKALAFMGLDKLASGSGPLWTRSYHDDLSPPAADLPNLREVFSCADIVLPDCRRILFLDTETTGLAGGTGTIVFLVGVSWWTAAGFETRQYFLPEPGHEAAMLVALGELAAAFEVVVTFNGASFDLPLLRTRARLNRLEDPVAGLQVWDLLVPARRLWGNRLENCRQQTLETEVCGMRRAGGDIDGSCIPQAWFDFLSTGRPGLLPRVLTHNRRDMVGMGRLFGKVAGAAGLIDGEGGLPRGLPWRDGWALGRICERRRDTDIALACLAAAVLDAPVRRGEGLGDARFLGDALRILKRGGDWKLVERMIRTGLAAGIDDRWLHREAAILYEHRLVDLSRALDHAVKSGEDHRVGRLQRLLDHRDPGR